MGLFSFLKPKSPAGKPTRSQPTDAQDQFEKITAAPEPHDLLGKLTNDEKRDFKEWYRLVGQHERLQSDVSALPPAIAAFHPFEELESIKRAVRHPHFPAALAYIRAWNANPPPLYVEPSGTHPAPSFNSWKDFSDYAQHHPSGGTLIGLDGEKYEERHPDVFLDDAAELFSNPLTVISFVDFRTQRTSKTGIRLRHMAGNLTDRKKFALQLVRTLELCGQINKMSKFCDEILGRVAMEPARTMRMYLIWTRLRL